MVKAKYSLCPNKNNNDHLIIDLLEALTSCSVELQRLRRVHLPKYKSKIGEPDIDVIRSATAVIRTGLKYQ